MSSGKKSDVYCFYGKDKDGKFVHYHFKTGDALVRCLLSGKVLKGDCIVWGEPSRLASFEFMDLGETWKRHLEEDGKVHR